VRLPTGVSVRALVAGSEHSSVAPIVCVHGWGIHSYLWKRTIPSLVAAGHRVHTLDLPGHGLSDRPLVAGAYTLDAMTAHLAAFLDARGIASATLIAQSMGGRVALELARTRPDHVRALALLGSVGFGDAPGVVALAQYVRVSPRVLAAVRVRRWMLALNKRFAYGTRAAPDPRDIDAYWNTAQFPDFVPAMRQVLAEFDWRPLDAVALRAIATPVLVVFGTRDRIIRPRGVEARVAALPQGRLEWIRDAGHLANEEAPEEVNPLLVEFVRANA
jgi:haloalkane dehalogenase